MSKVELYNGDCLKILQTIPSDSIDCIITSPPYNKKGFTGIKKSSGSNHTWSCYSIDYSTYSDDLPKQDYITWQINFLKECVRIIKPDGSIFYNHKPIRSKNRIVFHPMEILGSFNLYQEIIWDRKNSQMLGVTYYYLAQRGFIGYAKINQSAIKRT